MIIGYLSVVISVTVIDVPDALKAATLIWRHFPHISKSMSSPLDRSQYLATSLSLSPAAFFRQPCVCMEVKATSEWESHRDKSALIFPSVLIDLAAQYWPLSLCLSLLRRKHSVTRYEWCSNRSQGKCCQTCRVVIIQRCVKLCVQFEQISGETHQDTVFLRPYSPWNAWEKTAGNFAGGGGGYVVNYH